ncbi:FAD-binding protein [Paenibacillus sp.]|uniref:FAD-binding protein n=1 Tax=Paenibacillus sp. TaxID=58172 RepID=UPI002D4FC0B2|nr:FAD-binding protein [Paenibacillus sp.]HZG57239.1 FAD-binding protein [Paenibacillus sp.]
MSLERNWAGNFKYSASKIETPESVEQVQEIVAGSRRVKALGTRHSFNAVADTVGVLLSMERMNRVLDLDRAKGRVTVEGGVRYGELSAFLHANGYAVHNLASLPHITIAGAVATATHGSGDRNGNLATAVQAIEIVRADGGIAAYERDRPDGDFAGAVVGLGALGVTTKLTLNLVPAFDVAQTVYDDLPFDTAVERFDDIFSSEYSVSLFTDWKGTSVNQAWLKRNATERTGEPWADEWFGATRATARRHPVPGHSAEYCSEQLGIVGPWHERLAHFRMEFTPSAGEELQSEYFVPRRFARDALRAIDTLKERIAPLLYISEIRTVAADDLWLSPAYREDIVGIHFTWKPAWEQVRLALPAIEAALEPYEARPHWGKLFTMAPERVRSLYERLPDFRRLQRAHDPDGKFSNEFLRMYLA